MGTSRALSKAMSRHVLASLFFVSNVLACGGVTLDDTLASQAPSDGGVVKTPDKTDAGVVNVTCQEPVPGCDPGDSKIPMATPCPAGRSCYEPGSCSGRVRCVRALQAPWTDTSTRFVAVDDGGGFEEPPPGGSPCNYGAATYTYSRASRKLDWKVCDTSFTPFQWKQGSRTLSATEAKAVEGKAAALKPYTGNQCGADKAMLTVAITSPQGTTTYTDAFYACMGTPPYVDGIDALFAELRQLSP